jgi:Flp pilus assembly protein TadG
MKLFKHALRPQRGLPKNDSGIAAVEFALILPLMLMIYLGLVELSRGMRTAQKADLIAHTLADLTARQLAGGQNTGQAGLAETDIAAVFAAANAIMGLQPTDTSIKMTISEVNITSPSTGTWQARTSWTVARNGGTQRPCNVTLSPASAAPVSVATIPPSYVQTTNGVAPTTGPIIVADVIYSYSPGVNFQFLSGSSSPTWSMQRTSYAPVRNTYSPAHIQYFMTSGTNCNAPTP